MPEGLLFLLLLACQQVLTADPHDVQEKQVSQTKRRLSLQSTGEPEQQVWLHPDIHTLSLLLFKLLENIEFKACARLPRANSAGRFEKFGELWFAKKNALFASHEMI